MRAPAPHFPAGKTNGQSPGAPAWERLPTVNVSGLYVHVPFCLHKCHYCDFYSIARPTLGQMERFVDLVLAEADAWIGGARGPVVRPATAFVGGGTPSLLPLGPMRRLVLGLRGRFDLAGLNEWTVECNPATVSGEYCAMLKEAGVDRLSFGAQSFNEAELRLLERHHEPADVRRSIGIARQAGFRRLNVDLMYAIPGQSLDSWSGSLESAIDLGTEHISCYGLTYEPNTPISGKKRLGTIQPVDEDVELGMLHYARRRLAEAGYAAYEISNYALRGEECRHNLLYWNGGSYIGLGPSAASHVEGWRWRNRADLGEWEQAVSGGTIAAADVEHLTAEQRAGELVMLQLRLAAGVNFARFGTQTGVDARRAYSEAIKRLEGLGLIHVDEVGFGLTAAGLDVADGVAAEFLQPPDAQDTQESLA